MFRYGGVQSPSITIAGAVYSSNRGCGCRARRARPSEQRDQKKTPQPADPPSPHEPRGMKCSHTTRCPRFALLAG
jgi:hypothetical protein